MMFIVTQLMTKKEEAELQKEFKALDTNGDGRLSHEELLAGYLRLGKTQKQAEIEVNDLMKEADADANGAIDYSGIFLIIIQKLK